MENKRLHSLLDRFFSETYTVEEKAELMDLLNNPLYDDAVKKYLDIAWGNLPSPQKLSEEQSGNILSAILLLHRSTLPGSAPLRLSQIHSAACLRKTNFRLSCLGHCFLEIRSTEITGRRTCTNTTRVYNSNCQTTKCSRSLMLARAAQI